MLNKTGTKINRISFSEKEKQNASDIEPYHARSIKSNIYKMYRSRKDLLRRLDWLFSSNGGAETTDIELVLDTTPTVSSSSSATEILNSQQHNQPVEHNPATQIIIPTHKCILVSNVPTVEIYFYCPCPGNQLCMEDQNKQNDRTLYKLRRRRHSPFFEGVRETAQRYYYKPSSLSPPYYNYAVQFAYIEDNR